MPKKYKTKKIVLKYRIAFLLCFLLLIPNFVFLVDAQETWLEGFAYRKLITIAGEAGAGVGYTVYVRTVKGAGTDQIEQLTGGYNGVNATKVYLPTGAQDSFSDVRFTDDDGETILGQWRDSYVDAVSALWAVNITDSLETQASFYVYWGNSTVSLVSDAETVFQRVISSGVVLALPMNEGTGATVYDYSGNGNNGAISGAEWAFNGTFGNHLSFASANNAKVTVADNTALDFNLAANNYTIASWMKTTENEVADFLAKGNGVQGFYELRSIATGELRAEAFDSTNLARTDTTAVNDGVWRSFIVVFDRAANDITIYKNGVSDSTKSGTQNVGDCSNNQDLFLGYSDLAAVYWDGFLSSIQIFNVALNAGEITDLAVYYPQCSSANLGKLYLRSFVNPEPQPSSVGELEIPTATPTPGTTENSIEIVYFYILIGWLLICLFLGFKYWQFFGLIGGVTGFILLFGIMSKEYFITGTYLPTNSTTLVTSYMTIGYLYWIPLLLIILNFVSPFLKGKG